MLDAPARPGPNDTLPCGTDSARRRHLARAEECRLCESWHCQTANRDALSVARGEADRARTALDGLARLAGLGKVTPATVAQARDAIWPDRDVAR